MSRLTLVLIGLIGFFLGPMSWALSVNSDKGKIEFVAVGKPAMLKIKGVGKGPSGELKLVDGKLSGDLLVPLQSLDSGIGLRDEHMKNKYLEIAKFPDAVLVVQDFIIPSGSESESELKAILKFHGVEKPAVGKVRLKTNEKTYQVQAHLQIKLSDYQIEIPSYAGIKVADQVEVEVQTEVMK